MPIFIRDDIRVFYIHVPKTGGTYIETLFEKNGFSMLESSKGQAKTLRIGQTNKIRKCSPQHMHAEQINQIYNIKNFDYVFMTVRNPIFRLRSEFIMRDKNFFNSKNCRKINHWWKRVKEQFNYDPFFFDNHLRPQVEFYIEGVDVFKQEDSYDEHWAKTLESKIGIKFNILTIPRIGCIGHAEKEYEDDLKKIILDDNTFEDIRKFYQKDYSFFNYSPIDRW